MFSPWCQIIDFMLNSQTFPVMVAKFFDNKRLSFYFTEFRQNFLKNIDIRRLASGYTAQ